MKKLYLLLLMSCSLYAAGIEKNEMLTITLDKQSQEKMKLLLGIINPTDSLQEVAEMLRSNLSCKEQKLSGFDICIQHFDKIPSKNMLKKLALEGFPLVIFMQENYQKNGFEWRMYDTFQAQMQKGKCITRHPQGLRNTAHRVSDSLWELLTGQEGIFTTKLAYCVETNYGKYHGTDIYIKTPYADHAEQLIQGGKLLAPRWNRDTKNPLLLFSEVTPINIRLMSASLEGKRKLIANFDGLTMVPYFSHDSKQVAYCASYNGTSHIFCTSFDAEKRKKITQRITHNTGNNTSPVILANGDVVFCSDFETKLPQLYCLHKENNVLERLTQSGYCACPSFSEKQGKIAYCKLIGNCMQIFEYDITTKQHKQLTFNQGNKDECCWSPCGNYIAFSVDNGSSSKIALLNTITKEQTFVTPENQRCSYPSWSSKIN